jgi:hypothetical protein
MGKETANFSCPHRITEVTHPRLMVIVLRPREISLDEDGGTQFVGDAKGFEHRDKMSMSGGLTMGDPDDTNRHLHDASTHLL